MAARKEAGKKIKLVASMRRKRAPIWANIKKFGLKRARTRRIRGERFEGRRKL